MELPFSSTISVMVSSHQVLPISFSIPLYLPAILRSVRFLTLRSPEVYSSLTQPLELLARMRLSRHGLPWQLCLIRISPVVLQHLAAPTLCYRPDYSTL